MPGLWTKIVFVGNFHFWGETIWTHINPRLAPDKQRLSASKNKTKNSELVLTWNPSIEMVLLPSRARSNSGLCSRIIIINLKSEYYGFIYKKKIKIKS